MNNPWPAPSETEAMPKKLNYEEVWAKTRGRRDHDHAADAERRHRADKDDAARLAKRIAAGRPSKSKSARMSGKVTRIEGDAAAAIAAQYSAPLSKAYGQLNTDK